MKKHKAFQTHSIVLQGTDLEMWEAQSELRAKRDSSLKQLEEKLKCVLAEPRVTLEDFNVPSDGILDKEVLFYLK